MEKLVDLGLVKSIGISNFNSEQIDRLLATCRIKPVNNQVILSIERSQFHFQLSFRNMIENKCFSLKFMQVEASPQVNQKKLTKFCKERDIVVTAYCPLGR